VDPRRNGDAKIVSLNREIHGIMWNDTDIPLGYLISLRCYGTWPHGDRRGSIDRFHNRYKSPYLRAMIEGMNSRAAD